LRALPSDGEVLLVALAAEALDLDEALDGHVALSALR
jgi:hypothetical protein